MTNILIYARIAGVFRDAKDAPTSFEPEEWIEGFQDARSMIAERIALRFKDLPGFNEATFLLACDVAMSDEERAEMEHKAEPAPVPRVLIHMDGGLIQDIISDAPVQPIVIDYDTEGADIAELYDIPQDDGSVSEAFRSDWGVIHPSSTNVQFIDSALAAEKVEPPEPKVEWPIEDPVHVPGLNDALAPKLGYDPDFTDVPSSYGDV